MTNPIRTTSFPKSIPMFLPEIQHLPNFFKYFLAIPAALRGGISCKGTKRLTHK
jgi:hypothetical protein